MYPIAHKDTRGGHNRININSNFFKTWSPQMAYVLGFIFADGAIEDVQLSSRTCYLSITSKDLSILKRIRCSMNSRHRFYKKKVEFITYSNGKTYKSNERYVLRVGSKSIYNDLLKLGVTPRKSLTITFPNCPLNLINFFIRGYFDGDGCLHLQKNKYPRVIFTSGSLNFLVGLSQTMLKILNVEAYPLSIRMTPGKNPCYQLYYSNINSKKILEFLYRNLDQAPYLERKFQIYQNYLEKSGVTTPPRGQWRNFSIIRA